VIIRPRQIAVLGAFLILVAACAGEDDEPGTLPDVTPVSEVAPATTTPTATPTVEPPVEPSNIHEYSAEGVEAFTRYAIDVINYAYQTNDVTYLKQIMTPECQTCANVVAAVEGYVDEGARVEGGLMIVEHMSAEGPTEGVRPGAVADVTVTASRTFDGSGQLVGTEVDRFGQFVFFLAREESLWKLDGLTFGVEGRTSRGQSPRSSS
jgi:hypothetical protein